MTVNRDLADLAQSLQSGIDIADGGTGATSAAAARTALGTAGDGANTDITSLQEVVTAAASGVVEANSAFIDMCIVGCAVDGVSWAGKFSNGSVWTSLMLATVETAGSDAQVNIWDLTAGTLASATPLATLTLSGATPTSIAASMGYVIVGTSDQGIHIVDPHGGAWAERTVGWPRSLTSSTAPALGNNNVEKVVAGLSNQPPFDPRTGGSMPSFMANLGTTDYISFLFPDGTVGNYGSPIAVNGIAIAQGCAYFSDSANTLFQSKREAIAAGNVNSGYYILRGNNYPYGFMPDNALSFGSHGNAAVASADGLSLIIAPVTTTSNSGTGNAITRVYNTGYLVGDIRGAWLANSKTVDRSYKANTLTENGTVTEAAVASGAELKGYSGFSASNYLSRANDADYNALGTGSAYLSCWFKTTSNNSNQMFAMIGSTPDNERFNLSLATDGTLRGIDDGATATVSIDSTAVYDDAVWHKADFVRISSTERHLYADGVLIGSSTTDAGSLTATVTFRVGLDTASSPIQPADESELSLVRLSVTAPTATQIRQMYEAEAPMFAANAKCLLQSGSTDAVLDAKVDPLSGKVIVTQTDSQEIFDGLAIETERTIATGGSTFENGLLWGDAVAEINNANLFASTPATDQRQVNEMVRSLSADMPGGVDLSKAKAWIKYDHPNNVIDSSYNVESVADGGAGTFSITWATPFKDFPILAGLGDRCDMMMGFDYGPEANFKNTAFITTKNTGTNTLGDAVVTVVAFGELENE